MQHGNLLARFEDPHRAFIRREVRPFKVLSPFEDKLITADLDRLARRHAHVTLKAAHAGQHHTERTHRHAQVRSLHAPVATGQAWQAFEQAFVTGFLKDVAHTRQHHPGGQQANSEHRPVEITDQERRDNSQHHAADQHRGEHAKQPLHRCVLPTHDHTDGNDGHQQAHQWHKQRVEVRRPNGQFRASGGIQYQGVEGAEQDHRGGYHQNQVVDQQQGFPRPQGKANLAFHHRRADGKQRQGAAHHDQ